MFLQSKQFDVEPGKRKADGSLDLPGVRDKFSLWSVHSEIAAGSLVRALPRHWLDDRSVLWLVYPKSKGLTAKVRIFIDLLLDKIGEVTSSGAYFELVSLQPVPVI